MLALIKSFIKNNNTICCILFFALIILVGEFFFLGHYHDILADKGRELLFPKAILEGKVLYKDILCIYFPLGYLINACAYKIFGIHANTLMFMGIFNSILAVSAIFLISEEFLSKSLSFTISIFFIFLCVFNSSLFNYVLPYSYSLAYGSTAFLFCVYFAIKFLKSDNKVFIAVAFFLSGFAICCKAEFIPAALVLLIISFLFKPLPIKYNIINIAVILFVPLVTFAVLIIQGARLSDFINAFNFMRDFASTKPMIYHFGKLGTIFSINTLYMWYLGITGFWGLLFLIASLYKIIGKYRKLLFIIPFLAVYIVYFSPVANDILMYSNPYNHTSFLPLTIFLLLIFNYKKLLRNKSLFSLLLFSFAISLRTFWSLLLNIYGVFTAPLLIIAFISLILYLYDENKFITKYDISIISVLLIFTYGIYFLMLDFYEFRKNNTPVSTEYGTFYVNKNDAAVYNTAVDYIKKYSNKNQKVLFLQEGLIFNFLTDRGVDYKYPITDRLYYSAINPQEYIDSIKNSDYEMIFVIKGYGLTNFGYPYLFDDSNLIMKYILENYMLDWQIASNDGNDIFRCYVKPYNN